MSDDLIARIIRHEGFCMFPKYDARGFYEIGIGHDITAAECDNYKAGITYPAAMALLEQDIADVKQAAATAFPWASDLDPVRADIIFEMIFQLGIKGVMGFHKMIAAIQNQDWATASQAMLNSLWAEQTPARCEELAQMMLTGTTNT
jgi:lysozyme